MEIIGKITVDANRLMFPTQRRFNAAWQEAAGRKLRLLPQVALEMTHRRIDPGDLENEIERARTNLERVRNSATHRELLLRESDLWWSEELLRPDSPYELIAMQTEERERAEAICENIDPRAFPGMRAEEVPTNSDTMIIAQALVTGQKMLITGNMRLIEHNDVHAWAARHQEEYGIKHPDILYVQDEIMPKIFAGPEGKDALCRIGLAAAWPDNPQATMEEVKERLTGMISAMKGARLEETGIVIAQTWRMTPDPEGMLESVRARLPVRMRGSEARHPTFAGRATRRRKKMDTRAEPDTSTPAGSAMREALQHEREAYVPVHERTEQVLQKGLSARTQTDTGERGGATEPTSSNTQGQSTDGGAKP